MQSNMTTMSINVTLMQISGIYWGIDIFYNHKDRCNGHQDLPLHCLEKFSYYYLRRIGLMTGLICSKSSTRQGLLILIAGVTHITKLCLVSLNSINSLSYLIFFSHFFVYLCWSMHKAYLSATVVRIPISNVYLITTISF